MIVGTAAGRWAEALAQAGTDASFRRPAAS